VGRARDGVQLHYHVASVLRSAIRSGRYGPGQHLPGEHDLSARFGVSRATIRRALHTLEAEHLIDRHPGRGTIVLAPRASIVGPSMQQSLRAIEREHRVTTVEVLSIDDTWPAHQAARALAVDPDVVVRTIVRVRLARQVPLRYMITYVPLPLGRPLTRQQLETTTIVEALRRLGRPVLHADDEIGATLADPTVAAALGVRVGDPLLELTRTMFDDADQPIAFQWTVASPNVMKLHITIGADGQVGNR
jgi:GntR family transcriptional regulator